jgi:predicted nucleic acid-binding protein
MGMKALLDTSVLIDGIPEDVEVASISAISIAEMQFGVERARDPAERQRRLTWLGAMHQVFDPLPVDTTVASAWGGLASLSVERGLQPRRRAFDLLIAATALAHDLTLLTNDRDLLRLSEIFDVRRPAADAFERAPDVGVDDR